MSIEKVGTITSFEDSNVPMLRTMLDRLIAESVGFVYVNSIPTSGSVPMGKLVVYVSGSAMRLYIRTGQNSVGYVTLTSL